MNIINTRKAFTLVELLVTIAIIGLLATFVVLSTDSGKTKARDEKRLSDIKNIETALEIYKQNNSGLYPAAITPGSSLKDGSGMIYLALVPHDPNYNGSTSSDYVYQQINSGVSYALFFSLEKSNGSLAAGLNAAAPGVTLASANTTNVACVPTYSCASLRYNCGSYTDNCGTVSNCGTCSGINTCVSNTCVCVPSHTCSSLSYNCGTYTDSCGTANNCGTCQAGDVCSANLCAPDSHTVLLAHLDNSLTDSATGKTITPANFSYSNAPGYYEWGYSGVFAGSSYLTVSASSDFVLTGDFTIDFWGYFTNYAGYPLIVDDYDGSSAAGFQILLHSTAKTIEFYYNNAGPAQYGVVNAVSLGTWYHYAIVRNSSTIQSYLNGKPNGSPVTWAGTVGITGRALTIGRQVVGNSDYLSGYLDELRISNVARWTATFTPPTAPY